MSWAQPPVSPARIKEEPSVCCHMENKAIRKKTLETMVRHHFLPSDPFKGKEETRKEWILPVIGTSGIRAVLRGSTLGYPAWPLESGW